MDLIVRILDKVGVGAIFVAALSCAACFPALGSLAATLGLGFLSQLEGVMLNKLLPLFAVLALQINGYAWYRHRIHWRGFLSAFGPLAILATLYPLWQYGWSTYLFYAALILMLILSVIDFVWPAQPHCTIQEVGQ